MKEHFLSSLVAFIFCLYINPLLSYSCFMCLGRSSPAQPSDIALADWLMEHKPTQNYVGYAELHGNIVAISYLKLCVAIIIIKCALHSSQDWI